MKIHMSPRYPVTRADKAIAIFDDWKDGKITTQEAQKRLDAMEGPSRTLQAPKTR